MTFVFSILFPFRWLLFPEISHEMLSKVWLVFSWENFNSQYTSSLFTKLQLNLLRLVFLTFTYNRSTLFSIFVKQCQSNCPSSFLHLLNQPLLMASHTVPRTSSWTVLPPPIVSLSFASYYFRTVVRSNSLWKVL